jgi:hypothetical protein
MPEAKFILPKESIKFNELGEVEITDKAFAKAVADMRTAADVLACTTNNGCGNEVNGQGCGKVNAKCTSSFVLPDQLEFVPEGGKDPTGAPTDLVRLKNYDFAKAVLNSKLGDSKDIGVALSGLKAI